MKSIKDDQTKRHILVVEDEDDIVRLITFHLEKEGYRVTSADRPGHDLAQDRQDDPRRRGRRGPRANLVAAGHRPLPLRHRHADPRRADRVELLGRGDRALHRGRQPRLPHPRGSAQSRRRGPGPRALLLGLLHRPLPGPAAKPRRTPPAPPDRGLTARIGFAGDAGNG